MSTINFPTRESWSLTNTHNDNKTDITPYDHQDVVLSPTHTHQSEDNTTEEDRTNTKDTLAPLRKKEVDNLKRYLEQSLRDTTTNIESLPSELTSDDLQLDAREEYDEAHERMKNVLNQYEDSVANGLHIKTNYKEARTGHHDGQEEVWNSLDVLHEFDDEELKETKWRKNDEVLELEEEAAELVYRPLMATTVIDSLQREFGYQ
ncbi:hypothetical protein M231_00983 [Tremella mesenterica]|uniref:Uncharacterized protein n=1 Tax=Tremella mesenterica TaxID=5217 RepID=A0A4Q1BUN6_TREME|nr:uncharacterized protein TREMEDRAFT_61614 [Tremella mesenterica DSM 1558]EIW69844.1 hypothetical protein TREMEDRAFT_61614 [Tremella mesenterica DSM 1558]RXK41748.1 hypothetical protein M231_00983 [Tremella mesenterica]